MLTSCPPHWATQVHGRLFEHEPELLGEQPALQLLLGTAGLPSVPPALADTAQHILSACNGLPLALTLVGAQLYGRERVQEWQVGGGWGVHCACVKLKDGRQLTSFCFCLFHTRLCWQR